jgi:ribose-phosphate pyrophosphokinase
MEKEKKFWVSSGGVYPELVKEICESPEIGPEHHLEASLKRFASGELLPKPTKSVRGSEVILTQCFLEGHNGYSVNDALVESYLYADACVRADADEVTMLWPNPPYNRQERKSSGREPISAAATFSMAEAMGVHRIVSVDMHAPATQGAFKGPFNHLTAHDLIRDNIAARIHGEGLSSMIVAPDAGALKNNEKYADELGLDITFMPKKRSVEADSNGLVTRGVQLASVAGKNVYIIDDMIDTGGTLISAVDALKENGAKSVVALATHGLFSASAAERFRRSQIDQIVVTDTVPQYHNKELLGDRLEVMPIAPLLARAISRIVRDESVSELFHDQNNT